MIQLNASSRRSVSLYLFMMQEKQEKYLRAEIQREISLVPGWDTYVYILMHTNIINANVNLLFLRFPVLTILSIVMKFA